MNFAVTVDDKTRQGKVLLIYGSDNAAVARVDCDCVAVRKSDSESLKPSLHVLSAG